MAAEEKNEATNVVAFAPRPPELTLAQFQLHKHTCGIRLIVRDEADNAIVLEYELVAKPQDFDLTRLETAWARWRGCMGKAEVNG